jgi:hypothetical protein
MNGTKAFSMKSSGCGATALYEKSLMKKVGVTRWLRREKESSSRLHLELFFPPLVAITGSHSTVYPIGALAK